MIYKSARRIMLIYNDCKGNTNATIRIYAKKYGCTEETAAEKLKAAWEQRNRLLPDIDEEDDEEEPYEELLPDEWDYVSILEDGIEAEKIDKAFRSLPSQPKNQLGASAILLYWQGFLLGKALVFKRLRRNADRGAAG